MGCCAEMLKSYLLIGPAQQSFCFSGPMLVPSFTFESGQNSGTILGEIPFENHQVTL